MQGPYSQTPVPPPGWQPAPAEPRRFGAILALVLSFVSPELYRDVGRRWRGIGFWYLALLMLIAWTPLAVRTQIEFGKFVRDEAPRDIQTFPTIHVNKGVVSIDEPEPYLWRDADSGQVLLYVDTTGAFDLPEGKNAAAKLSKSKLEYRQNEYSTRVQDLSQIQAFNVDKNDLSRWLGAVGKWIGVLIFGVGFFFSMIGHLIQLLIYALIGLLFALIFNARLSYGALMRLAVVALTPAVILGLVLESTHHEFRGANFVYFLIEMLFLGIAVKANASGQLTGPPGYPMDGYPPTGQYPAPGGYAPSSAPGYAPVPPPVPPGYRPPPPTGFKVPPPR